MRTAVVGDALGDALDGAFEGTLEDAHIVREVVHIAPVAVHNHLAALEDTLQEAHDCAAGARPGTHTSPAAVCTLDRGGSAALLQSCAPRIGSSYRAIS